MRPADLFGVETATHPRYVLVRNTATARLLWNANNGTGDFECSDFLPRAILGPLPVGPHRLDIDGDTVTVSGPVASPEDVIRLGYFLEYTFAPLLTVQVSAYVDVDEVTADVGGVASVRLELARFQHGVAISTADHRARCVAAALRPLPEGSERFVIACLYFQHAERLASSSEARVPDLNVSEIIVNLAKCLQVLLGESRTSIRESCDAFGLTKSETEGCIVPIVLFRDQLDGAHAVASPVPQEMLDTLRQFLGRATHNTRALLLRVQDEVTSGRARLKRVVPDTGRAAERGKLVKAMKEYLAVDGLRIP